MYRFFFIWCLCFVCKNAVAHPMPGSMVRLFVLEHSIQGEAKIPLIELQNALGDQQDYDQLDRPFFTRYFLDHIRASTGQASWTTTVERVSVTTDTDSIIGKYREVVVQFTLVPPAGTDIRKFVFNYDVVIHQVITHKVFVHVQQDWYNGVHEGSSATALGVIALDIPSGKVPPFTVDLAQGSWLKGFRSMILLGMQHIEEGTDHLLFLLVLLLPAMLLADRGKWGAYGGFGYSVVRVLRIVTAFTLGHSITLLAGALGWVRLPQQLVEVIIAFSILISAIHAVKPVFNGREVYIAAGFGLIHGLAFATFIANMKLSAGTMALSILGFNLGIELMQLAVIALIIPWLLLTGKTPYYHWVRNVLAIMSAIAALAWMTERISGTENFITGITAGMPAYGIWCVLGLAAVAVSMYAVNFFRGKEVSSEW